MNQDAAFGFHIRYMLYVMRDDVWRLAIPLAFASLLKYTRQVGVCLASFGVHCKYLKPANDGGLPNWLAFVLVQVAQSSFTSDFD